MIEPFNFVKILVKWDWLAVEHELVIPNASDAKESEHDPIEIWKANVKCAMKLEIV